MRDFFVAVFVSFAFFLVVFFYPKIISTDVYGQSQKTSSVSPLPEASISPAPATKEFNLAFNERRGDLFANLGEVDISLDIYRKVQQKALDTGDFIVAARSSGKIAITLARAGNSGEAINAAKEALEYASKELRLKDTTEYLLNLGEIYYLVGQYDEALKVYRKAESEAIKTRKRAKLWKTFLLEGISYRQKGDEITFKDKIKKATFEIQEELKNAGKEGNPFLVYTSNLNLIEIYWQIGDYENALALIEKLLKYCQNNNLSLNVPFLSRLKGEILESSGKYDGAITEYQSVVKSFKSGGIENANLAGLYYRIGIILVNLGRLKEASENLKKAKDISSNGNDQDFRNLIDYYLALIAFEEKDYDGSISILEKSIISCRDFPTLLYRIYELKARVMHHLKMHHEAIKYFQLALECLPAEDQFRRSILLLGLGEILGESGNMKEAEIVLKQAILKAKESLSGNLNPGSYHAAAMIEIQARSNYLLGNSSEAINLYNEAMRNFNAKSFPDYCWRFHFRTGQIYEKGNQKEKAADAYKKAAEIIKNQSIKNEPPEFKTCFPQIRPKFFYLKSLEIAHIKC